MFRGRIPTSVRLEEVQSEQLVEVAAYLRQCREVRGLSLDEMASKTLIQRRTLQALEDADVSRLPEPVYVRGFIRRYASALGLKGDDVAEAYPIELGIRRSASSGFPGLTGLQLRPMHLYLLYLGVIGVAINGLSAVISPPSGGRSVAQVTQPNLEAVRDLLPKTTATVARVGDLSKTSRVAMAWGSLPDQMHDQVFPLDAQDPEPVRLASLREQLQAIGPVGESPKSSKAVQVTMKLVDSSWVRVTIDGKPEFEDVLAEGTQKTWQANERIVVRAGNAGGVMISEGNGPLKPLGVPGSVEEREYGTKAASLTLKQVTVSGLATIGD
jgi:cytoskeletal protein RodZ